jgi:hypothetical protein
MPVLVRRVKISSSHSQWMKLLLSRNKTWTASTTSNYTGMSTAIEQIVSQLYKDI